MIMLVNMMQKYLISNFSSIYLLILHSFSLLCLFRPVCLLELLAPHGVARLEFFKKCERILNATSSTKWS